MREVAVRMQGITKSFGSVQALRGADLVVAPGDVHALLGENGAGKSTLMHVLFGLVTADAGTVEVGGRPLPRGSPRAALAAGIGMVHQHFSQVPRMTVAENVWLGRPGLRYDRRAAEAAVRETGTASGLVLDPAARAEDLAIGLRQRLEIVKALMRDARVLILDEPTASLAPSEIDDLFAALRRLAQAGLAVVLITHKLREVAAIADQVTVLRQGRVVAADRASAFDAAALAAAMIGEGGPVAAAVATEQAPPPASSLLRSAPVLEVRDLVVRGPERGVTAVRDVSLTVQPHEIVGIAGIEGNGQRELLRAVAGFQPFEGSITLGGSIGFVPEDRQREGLLLDFPLTENLALGETLGFWFKRRFLEDRAAVAIDQFSISTPGGRVPVRALSGGNQQKVVLARVLRRKPALLVAENPTRGLDVRATVEVHAALRRAARDHGAGVLFFSTDLDEVLALADRIGVMAAGRWIAASEDDRSRERLGALMLSAAA